MKVKKLLACVIATMLLLTLASGCNKEKIAAVDSVKIEHIRISNSKMNVIIGAVYELNAKVLDKDNNVVYSNVVWTSSDSSIVKISDKGVIQGRKAGKVNIKAACEDKFSTIEVSVSYKEQVPAGSISSTNRESMLSDKAFDRDLSTNWISDITKASDESSDFLQANYNEKRELKKAIIKFDTNNEFCLPTKLEIYGLNELLGSTLTLVAEQANITNGEITIELDEVAYYQYYRIKFIREELKDFAVTEVELWSDKELSK